MFARSEIPVKLDFFTDAERFLNAYCDSQVATVGSKLGIVKANTVGDDML